jgi:phage-related protein
VLVRRIEYIQNGMGKPVVEEFMDSLDEKARNKVFYVLKLARELGILPRTFFKRLEGTDGLYELRIQYAGQIYRILCFFWENGTLVLTHGFQKKTQKTPRSEIQVAERWKRMYVQSKSRLK